MKNLNIKKLYALLIISVLFIATAKAQIVYTDVNPDTTITTHVPHYNYTAKTYNLDLNNDGTDDFKILTYRTRTGFYVFPLFYVKVTPLNTNEVLDSLSGSVYYPAALGMNSYVGANAVWRNTSKQILQFSISTTPIYSGFWSYNTEAFLGLKVIVGSDTCYGWVRLSIYKSFPTISFTIKDYAYNSIPNQTILAGETSCTAPTVYLSTSGPLTFCAGDSVTLIANGTGYKYKWKKNGVNISGAKSQTYIAKTAGIYKCKVTNSCGSKTSGGKTVTVPCRDGDSSYL